MVGCIWDKRRMSLYLFCNRKFYYRIYKRRGLKPLLTRANSTCIYVCKYIYDPLRKHVMNIGRFAEMGLCQIVYIYITQLDNTNNPAQIRVRFSINGSASESSEWQINHIVLFNPLFFIIFIDNFILSEHISFGHPNFLEFTPLVSFDW